MAPGSPVKRVATLLALICGPGVIAAQTTGAVSGHVRDAVTGAPLAGVRVTITDGRQGAVTDTAGAYRIREVRSGMYTVRALLIGYRPGASDSVVVRSGASA